MEGTTSVVSPTLKDYYEFIRELNRSCQLDFTLCEIIALVNQVDYVAENCELSSSAQDGNEQNNVAGFSLHSVIQVDSSPRGDTSKDVRLNNGNEKQRTNPISSLQQSQSASSRSVFVKPELRCLIIKLTSREHLAFRHYNKAERCIEKLNSFLATRNVQIYLSNEKPRITVKGNCDFGIFSGSLLTLIHLAGYWWDHRKEKFKSKSSFQLSKETNNSGLSEQLSKITSAQNSEQLAKKATASEPVVVAEDTSTLKEQNEAVATDRTSQSNCEERRIDKFITLAYNPVASLAERCPHLCKDFPDCFNTIPDRIVSNSCKVVYICTNSQHDLFIRADQQLDIIKRMNSKFEGFRISLLRKFPAFHVLPSEGVNPQPAINAINKLIDRCSSLSDIAEELRGMKKTLFVSNSEFRPSYDSTRTRNHRILE